MPIHARLRATVCLAVVMFLSAESAPSFAQGRRAPSTVNLEQEVEQLRRRVKSLEANVATLVAELASLRKSQVIVPASGAANSITACDSMLGGWSSDDGLRATLTKSGGQYLLILRGSAIDGSYPASCESGKLKLNLPLAGPVEATKDAFYLIGSRMIKQNQ